MMSTKKPRNCGGLAAENGCVRTSGEWNASSPPIPGCQRLVSAAIGSRTSSYSMI